MKNGVEGLKVKNWKIKNKKEKKVQKWERMRLFLITTCFSCHVTTKEAARAVRLSTCHFAPSDVTCHLKHVTRHLSPLPRCGMIFTPVCSLDQQLIFPNECQAKCAGTTSLLEASSLRPPQEWRP